MKLFGKKHIVIAEKYSDRIIDAMISSGKGVYSKSFWEFVKNEYNGDQEFSWSKEKNYIVFADEKDYTMFLLKVM
jgi:hypothetical protein